MRLIQTFRKQEVWGREGCCPLKFPVGFLSHCYFDYFNLLYFCFTPYVPRESWRDLTKLIITPVSLSLSRMPAPPHHSFNPTPNSSFLRKSFTFVRYTFSTFAFPERGNSCEHRYNISVWHQIKNWTQNPHLDQSQMISLGHREKLFLSSSYTFSYTTENLVLFKSWKLWKFARLVRALEKLNQNLKSIEPIKPKATLQIKPILC